MPEACLENIGSQPLVCNALDGFDTLGTPCSRRGSPLLRFAAPAARHAPGHAVTVEAVQRLVPLPQSKPHLRSVLRH